jgi:hypothetical protein
MTIKEPERNNRNFLSSSVEGKKAVIALPDKFFADFLIRINHENIPFRRFFRMIIEGYMNDDKRLLSFIEEAMRTERPKYQTKILKKEVEEVKEVEKEFGLDPNEIEDIYDILEEEFDD